MTERTTFPNLNHNPYMALTTYRKNGAPVMTPVWFIKQDGKLFVWTSADSGKAKRLRNNPCVQLGPSDHSGKLLGKVEAGQAHLVSERECSSVEKAFKAKYGWQMKFFSLIWKIQGHQHTYIEITPFSSN